MLERGGGFVMPGEADEGTINGDGRGVISRSNKATLTSLIKSTLIDQ